MRNATILVVDDEPLVRRPLAERLKSEGYCVLEAETGAVALEQLDGVDLVLLDDQLPDMDGVTVLRKIKAQNQDSLVILLTACARVDVGLAAMKLGAHRFVNKPCNLDEITAIVESAMDATRLRRELREFRASAARPFSLHSIVGNSAATTALRHLVGRVAAGPARTVLLTGENGTGKDLVAKVLHYASDRSSRPFVNVTCSALPEHSLERELFGHERGVFTDARVQKRGLLESADGGTLFFDEITELVPALQAQLVRFLEEKAFTRVGGSADIHVNVRVVAASNRHLEGEVAKGHFCSELFAQLNRLHVPLSPLRARPEDIPLLVEHFIDAFNAEFGTKVLGASPAAYAVLQRYGWPGNVRELRNVVERAMLLTDGYRLEVHDFASVDTAMSAEPMELPANGLVLEDLERSFVLQALRRSGWNQTRASALLGLNRDQIRYRIEKFGLRLTA